MPGPPIPPEAIQSIPMRWLLEGLLDERIVWDRPRPVSAKGFLSVVGESMVAPPAAGGAVSERSYAVLADRYLNFSIRAGYHFSVIDAYFGGADQGSYVHFRFAGGAADEERRARRCEFLKSVLSALQFRVRAREDRLTAWLDKAPEVAIRQALVALGRLTLCSRQLDMLMDGDDAPQLFAGAFLREEFAMF